MTGTFNRLKVRITRRDLLTASGTAAIAAGFGGASPARAQTETGAAQRQGGESSTAGKPEQQESQSTIIVERLDGGVLLVGIDRPEAQNRIDAPTFAALGQAYYQLDNDDGLYVAVLHGRGPDFSLGLDTQAWAAALASGSYNPPADFIDPLDTIGSRRSKPVVVAVHGGAQFSGHELFLAADVRVAASDTVFSQGEAARALLPSGGGTVRFPQEAGWGNAMRYMLTGDTWGADEAYRLGLVQAVTSPGEELDRAIEIAQKIAAAAPLGVRAVLASAHQAQTDGQKAAFAALLPKFGQLLQSGDRQEYLRAVSENRPPNYQGQ